MRISIIIPMYKVEAFIERCLNSCVHQDIPKEEYEIICVNDGSPDRSSEIAKEFAKQHSNIVVVDRENGGLSAARNTGLKLATGDYVWFVDSDDWIKYDCLENVSKICAERNLDILQICAANMIEGKANRRFSYTDEDNVFSGVEALKKDIQYCAPFSIYKREFLLRNNLLFKEGVFHEDNEFSPRAYYFAERVSSLNEVLYFVYQNPNSITRSTNPKKALDGIVVINSLHDFMEKIDNSARPLFHYLITSSFNGALHDTMNIPKDDVVKFETEMYKNKHLYIHLVKSGKIIYRIEGLLLLLFPHHPVTVYKMMNIFDRRKIKTQKSNA